MISLVDYFLNKGFLLSPEFIKKFSDEDFNDFIKNLNEKVKDKNQLLILNEDLLLLVKNTDKEISTNWLEFEKSKVFLEYGKDNSYNIFLDMIGYNLTDDKKQIIDQILKDNGENEIIHKENNVDENINNVIVIKNYTEDIKKIEVQDFVKYFRVRYNAIKKILINRPELKETISISRAIEKKGKERIAVIGMINNKNITKGGNVILELEDFTGKIKGIIKKEDKDLCLISKDIVFDEIIGITGFNNKGVIFADNIVYPDIPLNNDFKKLDSEEYAVFTGDLHVGSKSFLQNEFLKFIKWINCENGDEKQKKIAEKVKYLFILGDVIEGVGIYPGQFDDLEIADVYKQFDKLTELLSMIRKDVKIIICGGNHDALRIAEPQPAFDKDIAKKVYEMENVQIVTNPSVVNIASSINFLGFNVLMYHGFSFPYYADNVESIRQNGRLERADLIMKFLLQRRHLAPTHTSIQYIPNTNEDFLVIDTIPDFFVSGHIHRVSVMNYRNVTLLGCGCWTEQTDDQEKRGIVPDPSKVLLVNLQNRDIKILNFRE